MQATPLAWERPGNGFFNQQLYQGTTHAGMSGQTGARNEVWTQLRYYRSIT